MEQPRFIKEITLQHASHAKGQTLDVYLGQNMDNGQPELFGTVAGTQQFHSIFTVTSSECPTAANEVLLKCYSKNDGLLLDLLKAGIIKEPHNTHETGFYQLKRCYLA